MTERELAELLQHNPELTLVTDGNYTTVEPRNAGAVKATRRDRTTRITLAYPPSSNRYWRTTKAGRMYASEDATKYKEAVEKVCDAEGILPFEGDVSVTMRFFRPARRGDLDNRIKIMLDALQGHAFHSDSQVGILHAVRLEDKTNPRVEVEISPL